MQNKMDFKNAQEMSSSEDGESASVCHWKTSRQPSFTNLCQLIVGSIFNRDGKNSLRHCWAVMLVRGMKITAVLTNTYTMLI